MTLKMKRLLCYLCLFKILSIVAQIRECPINWQRSNKKCYLFERNPTRTYISANKKCLEEGATLVSVNDAAEHAFIQSSLLKMDPERGNMWYTSGSDGLAISNIKRYRWDGDGTPISNLNEFWISDQERNKKGSRIAYKFDVTTGSYMWTKVPMATAIGYICEIDQNEAYRIFQGARDFTYGSGTEKPEDVQKGPKFTTVPRDTLIVHFLPSYLDCVAEGNPKPSYNWYKIESDGAKTMLDPTQHTRYTFSDGRLNIPSPSDTVDAKRFQCEATNKFGSILSDPVQVSFGYLHEFSNVAPGDRIVKQYDGTYLSCKPPAYSPSVNFQWVKGKPQKFIIPSLNDYYQFISYNGNLYFSETQPNDAAEYSCLVTLNAPYINSFGLDQPPSRSSLSMKLVVTGETAADFGPTIHPDFIYVTPSPPMAGRDVRLECFAYGKMPLQYTWSRDGPWTNRHTLDDDNRVLIIKMARLEDSGNYKCRVTRSDAESADEKIYSLAVSAIPNFIFPLKDQHADFGQQLTWHCEAEALPPATYQWYKNSQLLQNVPNEIEIHQNSLWFRELKKDRDPGMYQCAAINTMTKDFVFSGAQLRVLEAAPSLDKQHLPDRILAASGGIIKIPCKAEGAPQPTIAWLKNGGNLNLSPQDPPTDVEMLKNHDVMLLTDGSLYITAVSQGDVGQYECVATNALGEAKASTYLNVVSGPVISYPPSSQEVVVRNSAFLPCSVSYDVGRTLDLVYMWKLNGYLLRVEDDTHYEISQGLQAEGSAGLNIRDANFFHEGRYECIVETPAGSTSASAYLTVLGPPAAPGGVYGDDATITQSSIQLTWTDGADHGSPVMSYIIEYNTEYTPEFKVIVPKIENTDTLKESDTRFPNRRKFTVSTLLPYVGYRFRIRAVNRYGTSEPSRETKRYQTLGDKPRKAPENIRGPKNFQAVGLLTMRWTALKPDEWGSEKIVYNCYWRKASDAPDGIWAVKSFDGTKGAKEEEYVALVGEENYYLPYEVMIGSHNEHGPGSNSTITQVLSAEAMPSTACTEVWGQGYNSTAFEAHWTPPPNTREAVGGRIKGFQVNWWISDGVTNAPNIWQIMKVRDDETNMAIVTGVEPNTNYWIDVQPFNTAGLGPRSEKYLIETAFLPPATFPKYVKVFPHSEDSVLVTWQGISTNVWEDTLKGYNVKYYKSQDDIRNAKVIVTDKVYSCVLPDIDRNVAYNVRIQGYNGGGDGSLSPSVYFTLLSGSGGGVVIDPHTTSQVPVTTGDASHISSPSTFISFLMATIILFMFQI